MTGNPAPKPIPITPNPEKDPINSTAVDYLGALKVSGDEITGMDNTQFHLLGISLFLEPVVREILEQRLCELSKR